tara:strand:+ start:29 stop:544 length:516 start_codon:yes stop_codon:yes gene_type:complete
MTNPGESDVELLAALVGQTSAELKKVDEQIVSSSANLQQSQANWNPHQVLKSHLQQNPGTSAQQQPAQQQVAYGGPETISEQAVQQMIPENVAPVAPVAPQQGYAQPAPPPAPQPVVNTEQLDRIERKVDLMMDTLKDMTRQDEKWSKFVDRGLKNKVKQVTIKLDDTNTK